MLKCIRPEDVSFQNLSIIEAAQVILGHAAANVTQIYAERDLEKAVLVLAQVG